MAGMLPHKTVQFRYCIPGVEQPPLMLRVSKLSDYATVLLVELAADPVSIRCAAELAEVAHLELPTVSKVLKMLTTAGLVASYRGVAGGYRLARSPKQVSVAQIVEAIEGPIGMTECSLHDGACSHESHCGVRGPWQRISRVVVRALREVSLADMLEDRPVAGTPPPDQRIAIQVTA